MVRVPVRHAILFSIVAVVAVAFAGESRAESTCLPDGLQASGSVYRICMPAPADYNGFLVVFAHGFQDAGEPVGIPDEQLQFGDVSIAGIVNALGFGFATNSYSKTGLAVVQGMADLLDLVEIYSDLEGPPEKVFLVGGSEGGLITTLLVEQHPEVFAGGLAACGPVGSFPRQIDYFGDARATFDYFFPGLIPGDPLAPPESLVEGWDAYYENVVRPTVFAPYNADLLGQWVAVAKLPFDPDDPVATVEESVRTVLTYEVVNQNDAVATLGGQPFDNRPRWYHGSDNDLQLNLHVMRVDADPAAVDEMHAHYDTTGELTSPLVTIHTKLDPVIPQVQELLYAVKTLQSGSLFREHVYWPISRYGHCNFTLPEVAVASAILLLYTGDLGLLANIGDVLPQADRAAFDRLAERHGVPLRATHASRRHLD